MWRPNWLLMPTAWVQKHLANLPKRAKLKMKCMSRMELQQLAVEFVRERLLINDIRENVSFQELNNES